MAQDLLFLIFGEGVELFGLLQMPAKLGVVALEVQVVAGLVSKAAAHDDGGAFKGKSLALGVTGHLEGFEGGCKGHLLASGDKHPLHRILTVLCGLEAEGIHGSSQLGVGLVHRLAIFAEEEGGIHAVGVHLFDGVVLGDDVVPEGVETQGIGVDTTHTHDGDLVVHHVAFAGEHLKLVQVGVEAILGVDLGVVHRLDGGGLLEEGEAVSNRVVAFVVGLIFGVVDVGETFAFFQLVKVGRKAFGGDKKGADVVLFKGALAVSELHLLHNALVLVGNNLKGERGLDGTAGETYGGADAKG